MDESGGGGEDDGRQLSAYWTTIKYKMNKMVK